MALTGGNISLRRLKNHYRLVITNEDTFEEVIAFKMNRWSVYVTLSALFLVLVGLTISLIAFTPLKFYIPGYGEAGKAKEYEMLKVKADSIERTLILKQEYINDVERILKGEMVPLDTTSLKVK
ncbi:MAG: hypothetical protein ABIR03_03565 [Ginsengibacter sp.]